MLVDLRCEQGKILGHHRTLCRRDQTIFALRAGVEYAGISDSPAFPGRLVLKGKREWDWKGNRSRN